MFEAKLYKYINTDGKIEGYPQVSDSAYSFLDLCSRYLTQPQHDDHGPTWKELVGSFR